MHKPLVVLVLSVTSFFAAATEPSDASIERLLSLMKAESLTDSIYVNLEDDMRQRILQATAGKQLNDGQRRVLEGAPRRFAQAMREKFNWSTLKPMYIKIYKESFDQEDIDGLNVFYSSKVGQAYISKMPGAMQRSMAMVQDRLTPLMGKMAEAMKAAVDEAKLGK